MTEKRALFRKGDYLFERTLMKRLREPTPGAKWKERPECRSAPHDLRSRSIRALAVSLCPSRCPHGITASRGVQINFRRGTKAGKHSTTELRLELIDSFGRLGLAQV